MNCFCRDCETVARCASCAACPNPKVRALDELRAVLCGVGIVGQIDGHDVIRRDSVIDLVDRRRSPSWSAT